MPTADPAPKPSVFLDSGGLIAAVMSPSETSDSRQLLRLGEAEVIALRVNREVLRDVEFIVRRRKATLVAQLALILNQANVTVVADGSPETIRECLEMTGYLPDARVLAAAIECDADIFVTQDAEHFLGNPLIGPPKTRLRVLNTHQAVEWCRERLSQEGRSQQDEDG